jgi:hypothetical protein
LAVWSFCLNVFKTIVGVILPVVLIILAVWIGVRMLVPLFGVDFTPALQKAASRTGAAIAAVIPEPSTSKSWNEEAHRADVAAKEAQREAETARIYANAHAAAETSRRARDRGERASNDLIYVYVKTRAGTNLPAMIYYKTTADPSELSVKISDTEVGSIEAVPGITYSIWAKLEDGSGRYCETKPLLYEGGQKKVVLYF